MHEIFSCFLFYLSIYSSHQVNISLIQIKDVRAILSKSIVTLHLLAKPVSIRLPVCSRRRNGYHKEKIRGIGSYVTLQ